MPYQTGYFSPNTGIPSPLQSGGMMYAGGPGGDPTVGSGLLGSPSNYPYPLTSGLMGAISQPGAMQGIANALALPQGNTPNYTQMALQLAGNPHAGPYAGGLGIVPPGTATPSAGSTSDGSSGSNILGGLLGAVAKNPSLLKNIGSLLGSNSSATAASTTPTVVSDGSMSAVPGTAEVTDTAGGTTTTFGDGLGTTTTFGDDTGALGTTTTFDTGGGLLGGDAAATAAGGEAAGLAPVGVDAATATPTITGLGADAGASAGAGAGAGSAGGASSGLGAAAGVAAAAAPFAVILGKMLMNPDDVMLKAPYWASMANALQGKGSNINTGPGGGGAAATQYAISDAVQEALSTPQSQVPAAIQQAVWNTGLVPYGTWSMPNTTVAPGAGGIAAPGNNRRNYAQ